MIINFILFLIYSHIFYNKTLITLIVVMHASLKENKNASTAETFGQLVTQILFHILVPFQRKLKNCSQGTLGK